MIWDEFLRHFRFCDEEDSGLSDEEQERKRPKNRPKHTRKRIHQDKKNFLEKFKTASNLVVFDADSNCETRRRKLSDWERRSKVNFELFLFPNNSNSGELEDLLRQIINPVNQPVMECWDKYEDSLKAINLPWKNGIPLTIPAKKTRIYAYLEALLGSSRSEKEKIKEAKRDYLNKNHWDLNAQALHNLIDFLESNLS